MELPLILSGPILRRVEPGLVSVWVALSKACSVQLSLFEGLAKAGDTPKFSRDTDTSDTIAIGDFITEAYTTALQPGELVTSVRFRTPPSGSGGAYIAYSARQPLPEGARSSPGGRLWGKQHLPSRPENLIAFQG